MHKYMLTPSGRRHLRLLAGAVRPIGARLNRRFRDLLQQGPYDAAQRRALLAITPVAAARMRTLDEFLEEVEYHGRRLARLNMPVTEVSRILAAFNAELALELADGHGPAREQLQLIC